MKATSNMSSWPDEISMKAFCKVWQLDGEPVWQTVFEMHQDRIQVKKASVAVANLEKILKATFKLTAEKGFQSMSLRDLCRESGISMGGLYAYIGSKNDLASMIEAVLRHYIHQVLGSLTSQDLDPVRQLQAIVFGETYMNEIMHPWFYFCYMELKGLPRDQQEKAMDLELEAETILIDVFRKGISQGVFVCANPEMMATHTVAVLQQWYLKRWKFKRMKIDADAFANSVFMGLLQYLDCSTSAIPEISET